jgi:hypothetical protein
MLSPRRALRAVVGFVLFAVKRRERDRRVSRLEGRTLTVALVAAVAAISAFTSDVTAQPERARQDRAKSARHSCRSRRRHHRHHRLVRCRRRGRLASSGPTATINSGPTHVNALNPPSAPTGLSATARSTAVSLSWTASTDPDSPVAGYRVYRNGAQIATSTATTYTDTGLTNGTTYTYYVIAYDAGGNVSAASATVSATPTADPSGVPMPVGNVPGWRQVFADNFANESVPLGAFSGCAMGADLMLDSCSGLSSYSSAYQKWWAYPDGWKDGTGGTYYPSKVISISGGVMNLHIHTATINGTTSHLVSTPVPKVPGGVNGGGLLYGRYVVRFRMGSLPGYKIAFMLWPDSGIWPQDGEIDFPEQGQYGQICAFMHWMGGTKLSDADRYCSTDQLQGSGWHTAQIDWTPTACTFTLDGTVLGSSTDASKIPSTPMHWNLQTSTSTYGVTPTNATAGNVQIDWVTAYTPT